MVLFVLLSSMLFDFFSRSGPVFSQFDACFLFISFLLHRSVYLSFSPVLILSSYLNHCTCHSSFERKKIVLALWEQMLMVSCSFDPKSHTNDNLGSFRFWQWVSLSFLVLLPLRFDFFISETERNNLNLSEPNWLILNKRFASLHACASSFRLKKKRHDWNEKRKEKNEERKKDNKRMRNNNKKSACRFSEQKRLLLYVKIARTNI